MTEESRIYAELGKRIKAQRKNAGMSQATLAENIGKAERTLERYESGQQAPALATIYRIADSLRISIGKLVTSPGEWKRT